MGFAVFLIGVLICLILYIYFNKEKKILNLENENEKLKEQIENMTWEWNKEKETYCKKTYNKFLEQKADLVIDGEDLKTIKELHTPLYGINFREAIAIGERVSRRFKKEGINVYYAYHNDKKKDCYVIDIEVNKDE